MKMMVKIFFIVLLISIFILGILIYLNSSKDTVVKKSEPQIQPLSPMDLKKLSIMDSLPTEDDFFHFEKKIEKMNIEKRSNTHLKITPVGDFYNLLLKNNLNVSNTLKQIDFKRPPIKFELKINF